MKIEWENASQRRRGPGLTPERLSSRGTATLNDEELGGRLAVTAEDWLRLQRFLRFGTEGGGHQVGDRNSDEVTMTSSCRCIRADARRVVECVVSSLVAAPLARGEARIRVLAQVTAMGDEAGRAAACEAVPKVCRTAAELFQFAENVTALRGWGRSLRRAVGNWYRVRFADDLAYQVVKCPRRDGWTHRDLLRLSHPTPASREQAAVFRWILGGPGGLGRRTVIREVAPPESDDCGEGAVEAQDVAPRRFRSVTYPAVGELPRLLRGVNDLRRATTRADVVRIIVEYDLPREAVPEAWLEDVEVWEALLHRMPMGAMIRDLGRMSAVGLLVQGSEAAWWVENRLRDPLNLRASGLHPMALYLARRAYESGTAEGGRIRWLPVPSVARTLDDAFYAAFRNVTPVGKPMLVALDGSRSTRTALVPGTAVTVREAAAAMALVLAATEPECVRVAFTSPVSTIATGRWASGSRLALLEVAGGMRVEEVLERWDAVASAPPDCGLPMSWALRNGLRFEAFVVLTDGDVWAGNEAPSEALARYNAETGAAARSVVVGMSGGAFRIADPGVEEMLDVIGFDGATPGVVSDFLRG